jgi:hypothetical protein
MAQAKYDEFKALSSDRRGQIGVINAVRVAIGGPTTRRSASAHRRRSSSLRSAAMRARRGHSTTSIVVRRGHATKRLRHLRYLRHRTPRIDPQSAPCAPPSLRNTMSNKNNEEAETSLINDCTTSYDGSAGARDIARLVENNRQPVNPDPPKGAPKCAEPMLRIGTDSNPRNQRARGFPTKESELKPRPPQTTAGPRYCATMLTNLGARMITLATSRPARARTTDSSARARERSSSSPIPGGTCSRPRTFPWTCTTQVTD